MLKCKYLLDHVRLILPRQIVPLYYMLLYPVAVRGKVKVYGDIFSVQYPQQADQCKNLQAGDCDNADCLHLQLICYNIKAMGVPIG
ncbi:MAG: hypothetical protein WA133_11835 [Syntrophales bacterium]